jgi:hypothetical protein
MRKMIVVATVAAVGGFCLASATAFAALRYNIWQASSEQFQLGYVIGYLDAAALAQKRDSRARIAPGPGKNYDLWVKGVNAFYENPANQSRSVADAMADFGTKMREDLLREWGRKRMGLPPASPSPQP